MKYFNEENVQRESQHDVAALRRSTRYSEVVNRYLGALAHAGPAPAAVPRTAPARGTVLAAVDDSPASFVAADHAAIEAELHGWKLRLVHVRQTAAPRSEPDPDAALLEQLTDRVHARSRTVPVTSSVLVGVPVATLLAEAKGADLVVVGSRHGTTGPVLGRAVSSPIAWGMIGHRLRRRRSGSHGTRRGSADVTCSCSRSRMNGRKPRRTGWKPSTR